MVNVRLFGMARINFDKKAFQIEAASVKELVQKMAKMTGIPKSDAKQYLIFVNEINIDKLKRFRTKLNDGDEVLFLSPSSGG